jgi:hypothetical protein
MLTLFLLSTLGCDIPRASYGYYAAPKYTTSYYSYTPKVAYTTVPTYYHAPAYQQAPYNSSLVGQYLRDEQQYKNQAEYNSRIDRLLSLMEKQAQQPAPQPQPFQYQSPPVYSTPQTPAKSVPYSSPQLPEPTPSWTPPPPIAPSKPIPSFGESAATTASLSMTSVLRNRCFSCHNATDYARDGGGLRLAELDGSPARDILDHAEAIFKETDEGRMPKKSQPLNQAEKLALYGGLQQLAANSRPGSFGP